MYMHIYTWPLIWQFCARSQQYKIHHFACFTSSTCTCTCIGYVHVNTIYIITNTSCKNTSTYTYMYMYKYTYTDVHTFVSQLLYSIGLFSASCLSILGKCFSATVSIFSSVHDLSSSNTNLHHMIVT